MTDLLLLSRGRWRAAVAPALGGNLVRLDLDGRPVLRPLTDPAALAQDPFVFGSPILLPANRTRGGAFSFEGERFSLPVNEPAHGCHLHGFVHRQRFSVECRQEDAVTLSYENRGEVYPFPFRLTVSYQLFDEGECSLYRIENTGCRRMPFTFGLHTTFAEPAWFSVPVSAVMERDSDFLPTGRYLPLRGEELDFSTRAVSRGRRLSGYYRAAGHTARIGDRLRYTVSEAFDHWVLYNAGGREGLLCIEPQCGAVDGLNLPGGCRVLSPGEALRLRCEIRLGEEPR